jgi:sugar lactone lactonase YvrE
VCDFTSCSGACVDTETDEKNCGMCGKVCDGQCYAGHCRTQLVQLAGASSVQLALDKKDLYFTARGLGTVNRMPLAGGTVEALAEAQSQPNGLAVDATNVYWVTQGGKVMKRARDGQTAAVVLSQSDEFAHDIAVDATNVYWTISLEAGSVVTVPIGGGTRKVLATGADLLYPTKIAVDETNVYWVNKGSTPRDGSVMKVPLEGGTATPLAEGYEQPQDVVIYNAAVYFSLLVGISKVSASGGVSVVSSAPQGATPIAVDSSGIFCRLVGGGRDDIARISLDGKTVTTLAATPALPTSIAMSSTTVYWATGDAIYSVSK